MTKSTHFHLLTPSPFIYSGKIANPLFLISPLLLGDGEYARQVKVTIAMGNSEVGIKDLVQCL